MELKNSDPTVPRRIAVESSADDPLFESHLTTSILISFSVPGTYRLRDPVYPYVRGAVVNVSGEGEDSFDDSSSFASDSDGAEASPSARSMPPLMGSFPLPAVATGDYSDVALDCEVGTPFGLGIGGFVHPNTN